ncbi:hypothetical protein H5410_045960 [Solanum commersonii]|uniref:Uncharacterized protein n=1 Tax=Solanum commersonii TaxID=4109 RepID=A0A9J5XE99_SOLCO|nr:hypothetical protein H5410_045960 [Solanum commersonii]
MFVTKGMTNEGDFNATRNNNIYLDGGNKSCKGKKHHKSSEEVLLDPTPSEVLTSHRPLTTKQVSMTVVMSPLMSDLERSGSQGLKR